MTVAEQLIARFQEFGFFNYVVPFLLVWILFYGILKKINIFGETANIDEVLSIIAAFLVVSYTPFVEQYFQVYVTNLFGAISILLIAMLGFFLLVGMMLGDEGRDYLAHHRKYIMGAIGLAVVFLFVSYGGPRMIFSPGQMEQIGVENMVLISQADFYLLLIGAGVVGFMYWTMGGFRNPHQWKITDNTQNPPYTFTTKSRSRAETYQNQGNYNVTYIGSGEDPLNS
ncbi:MAG: hypothetical protein SVU32_05660 [Candidatus Nanohaloarchaea archaeon]|nr:hypothetical protein [Candidatus Nanohaloarchaea archaeon]